MSETFSKVEVIIGVARRRRFTTEQKLLVVNETLQPGMSISYVARRYELSPEPGLPMETADERRGQDGVTGG
jgi:transposase